MAYESNDARNRSESYKEGGKVTLSKKDKDTLAIHKDYILDDAKRAVGKTSKYVEPESDKPSILDIVKSVDRLKSTEASMKRTEAKKRKKKKK